VAKFKKQLGEAETIEVLKQQDQIDRISELNKNQSERIIELENIVRGQHAHIMEAKTQSDKYVFILLLLLLLLLYYYYYYYCYYSITILHYISYFMQVYVCMCV
jgi:hypothetical protein